MRNLTQQEIHHVHGANFTEDITTLSASVYVAIQIGTAAGNITHALTEATISALGFNQLTILSNFLPTIAAVALPLAIAGSILQANPEMEKTLIDKCYFYFYGPG